MAINISAKETILLLTFIAQVYDYICKAALIFLYNRSRTRELSSFDSKAHRHTWGITLDK